MHPLIRFVGAFVLAYFVSRITLRLALAGIGPRYRSLVVPMAHALALVLIAGLVWVMRSHAHAFSPRSLFGSILAQMLWLTIDSARKVSHKARKHHQDA